MIRIPQSRRAALVRLAGMAASLSYAKDCLSASVANVSEDDSLKLGFTLYGMQSLGLDDAIRTCAQIGYSHVEFCLNAGYPTEPSAFTTEHRKATRELLTSVGLEVSCFMVLMNLVADESTHAKHLELIATAGQMASELSPLHPPILETVLGGSPEKWDRQKEEMLRQLKDWAIAAEKISTIIAIKAHISSAVNSPERLLWLLDRVQSDFIYVAYDFSHFEIQGIDLQSSLKMLLPRTRFIHLKDTTGDAKKFQFLLPGQGRTDYVKYFRLLRENNFAGPVCVEVSGQVFSKPEYDARVAAKRCYDVLSKAMTDSR